MRLMVGLVGRIFTQRISTCSFEIFWLLKAFEPDLVFGYGDKGTLLLDEAYQKLCEACGHDREFSSQLRALGVSKTPPDSSEAIEKIKNTIPQMERLKLVLTVASEALVTYVRKRSITVERSTPTTELRASATIALRSAPEKSDMPEWYVSYAWGMMTRQRVAHASKVSTSCAMRLPPKAIAFCETKDVLGLGDSISAFMKADWRWR